MDAKSHKDNMEKFFHEKWDDHKMSQELGVPDLDDMWSDIKDQSAPQKKRRRIFWWIFPILFIPTAIFLLLSERTASPIAGISFNVNDGHEGVKALQTYDVIESEKHADQLVADASLENIFKEEYSRLESNELQVSQALSKSEAITVKSTRKVRRPSENMSNIVAVGSSRDQNATNLMVVEPVADIHGFVNSKRTDRNQKLETEMLEPLRSNVLHFESNLFLIDSIEKSQAGVKPNAQNKYALAFIGSSGIHMYTGQSGSQNINGIDVALEDGRYWGAGIELGMKYRSNKMIKVGLAGKRHSFRSHYELMVNYSGNSEIQDGEGNWHSGYNHSLPTLFGDSPMSHILIRGENDDLQEGEVIPFALFLEHQVDEVALTLAHEWIVPFKHVNVIVGASGQFGYWYTASKIASVKLYSHHDKVWHNQTSYEIDDYQIAQPFNIGFGANLGVQYSLNDRHAVGFQTRLSQTLLGPKLFGNVVWAPTLLEGGVSYVVRF